MSAMLYKGYTARVEFDAEDHIFVGRLAGITDIVTFHGVSVEELEAEFRAAVDHYLLVSEQVGIPPQPPSSGELVLKISPDDYAYAVKKAEIQGKSIHQWATETLTDAIYQDDFFRKLRAAPETLPARKNEINKLCG